MQSRNRTLWIVVLVLLGLGLLCCCAFVFMVALLMPSRMQSTSLEGLRWLPGLLR